MDMQPDEFQFSSADEIMAHLELSGDMELYQSKVDTPASRACKAWVEQQFDRLCGTQPAERATPQPLEWSEDEFHRSLIEEGLDPNNAQEFVAALQSRGYTRGLQALARISQLEASEAYKNPRLGDAHRQAVDECLAAREVLHAEKSRWMSNQKRRK